MPNTIRSTVERYTTRAVLGLGGVMLYKTVSGYFARREARWHQEDMQRHIAEKALEREAELQVPEEPGEMLVGLRVIPNVIDMSEFEEEFPKTALVGERSRDR